MSNPFDSYSDEDAAGQGSLHEKLITIDENEDEIFPDENITEKMWTQEYIGLYAHYAGVGINGGISGLILNFCVYYFHGSTSLCPNAGAIIFLPW